MANVVIHDPMPGYGRYAVLADGFLVDLLIDDASCSSPRPGSLYGGRVVRRFPAHQRVLVDIGGGLEASLRVSSPGGVHQGALLGVEIQAEAREGKRVSARRVKADAGGLKVDRVGLLAVQDMAALARDLAPDAEWVEDMDGSRWQELDIDRQIEQALEPCFRLDNGGVIHISTPPGAAVIDGDSASAGCGAEELALAMVEPLARQLRLRRIGGPVVIDFPRLGRSGRDAVHAALKLAVAPDPCGVVLHGWTRGGLYTLDRRHGWRPLRACFSDQGKQEAVGALRRLWRDNRVRASGSGLRPKVALGAAALAWLEGEGKAVCDAVISGLALSPEWISASAEE